jgi:hypothetical protein
MQMTAFPDISKKPIPFEKNRRHIPTSVAAGEDNGSVESLIRRRIVLLIVPEHAFTSAGSRDPEFVGNGDDPSVANSTAATVQRTPLSQRENKK